MVNWQNKDETRRLLFSITGRMQASRQEVKHFLSVQVAEGRFERALFYFGKYRSLCCALMPTCSCFLAAEDKNIRNIGCSHLSLQCWGVALILRKGCCSNVAFYLFCLFVLNLLFLKNVDRRENFRMNCLLKHVQNQSNAWKNLKYVLELKKKVGSDLDPSAYSVLSCFTGQILQPLENLFFHST